MFDTNLVFLCLWSVAIAGSPIALHFTPSPDAKCTESTTIPTTEFTPNNPMKETATNLIRMAAIAYCPPESISLWKCPFCSEGFQVLGVYSTDETIAFIVASDDTIVVSFRGTHGATAGLKFLEALPTAWPPGSPGQEQQTLTDCNFCIHQGYADIFKGIMASGLKDKLTELLQKSNIISKNIFITGHSMGGSMASILGYELATTILKDKDDFSKLNIYTFGSPRIFTAGLAGRYDDLIQNSYRFVHNKDPIPHLPPEGPYEHVGDLVFCKQSDIASCVCVGDIDNDGGNLLSHHSTRDHLEGFGINLDLYSEDSSSVGCDAVKETLLVVNQSKLRKTLLRRLKH